MAKNIEQAVAKIVKDQENDERQQLLWRRRQWAEDLDRLLVLHQTLDREAWLGEADGFGEQWGLP